MVHLAMLSNPSEPMRSPSYRMGALVFFLAAAVILTALAFEHFGGYAACPLCLQERWAYYAGIPALFFALVLLSAGRTNAATVVFALVALAFFANAGLGTYHAGAEWKFWPGPDTCAGAAAPLGTSAGGLLKELATTRVVRCDEAPWHFLGLSFAGWNAVVSLLLAAGTAHAAIKARHG
jgi:disulfide bond formation protein DsbB